jgi:hypothetical protein
MKSSSFLRLKYLKLSLISCLLIFVSTGFKVVPDNDKIYWSPNVHLNWDDFTGTPNNAETFDASTETSVKCDLKGDDKNVTITIVCFFEKSKSWVKREKKGDTLLKHEQAHFDLAELYTRKLRKAMKEAKFTSKTINSEFKKVYQKYIGDLKKEQDRYDKETRHSIIYPKQKEWEARIAQDLNAMNEFSGSVIEVKVRG